VEPKSSHPSRWFREYGKALDPDILKTSAFAVLVGFIGGLVAQGLLELIYLFTNIFGRFLYNFKVLGQVAVKGLP